MRKSVLECLTNRALAPFESTTRRRALSAFADRKGTSPAQTGGKLTSLHCHPWARSRLEGAGFGPAFFVAGGAPQMTVGGTGSLGMGSRERRELEGFS